VQKSQKEISSQTTIDQTALRLLPYIKALSYEELKKLQFLVRAQVNIRLAKKKDL
jgi:hypothetical protein